MQNIIGKLKVFKKANALRSQICLYISQKKHSSQGLCLEDVVWYFLVFLILLLLVPLASHIAYTSIQQLLL